MRIKWFYGVMILTFLVGVWVARSFYNAGIFPLFSEDERVLSEIRDLAAVDTGIVCLLIPQKIYHRIGEKPQIDVLIINKTDSVIYLPDCLDGSSDRTRLPYCDIKILSANTQKWGIRFLDINPNPLVETDLQLLHPNECFDPLRYKLHVRRYDADSIWSLKSHTTAQLTGNWLPNGLDASNYLLPKNYKIQFVYSTEDSTTSHGWNMHCYKNFNLSKLDSIPKISIKSNVITLRYRLI